MRVLCSIGRSFHLVTISRGTRLCCNPGPHSDIMLSISYRQGWIYACDIGAMVAEEDMPASEDVSCTRTDVGSVIEGGSNQP